MTLVKLCGITSVDDALEAARAGADQLGFILAPGTRRSVEPQLVVAVRASLESALEIGDIQRRLPELVGVVTGAEPEAVRAVVAAAAVDVIQLSGPPEPSLATFRQGGVPAGVRVVRVVHVGPGAPEQARAAASDWERRGAFVLFDAHVAGSWGGTGTAVDVDQLVALCSVAPRGVAGGLTPDNVAGVIRRVRPVLVDVSSGVEDAPGRKDPARMRAFVSAVHHASEELP